MKKRVSSLLLACLLLVIPHRVLAKEVVGSGACGSGLRWELDSNGTLSISGSGDMTDYTFTLSGGDAPWYPQKDRIRTVVLGEGVTSIGDCAFYKYSGVERITVGDSLREIGFAALNGTSITELTLPDSVKKLGYSCFGDCTKLRRLVMPTAAPEMEQYVLYNCIALEEIVHCPDPEWAARIARSRNLLDQWINPGAYVGGQSERITTLAKELTRGLTTDYEKARAISQWMEDNIPYDHYEDEGREYSSVALEPEEVLDRGTTVCEGYARLTQALFRALDIPCLHLIGWLGDIRDAWHAWNLALVDGRWIWLDNTGGMARFDVSTANFAMDYDLSWGVKVSLTSTVAPEKLTKGSDIPSAWAKSGTWAAITAGLVPGDLQANYRSNITREEFCRLMVSLLEQHTGQEILAYLSANGLTPGAFRDTSNTAVQAASALGIVYGRGNGIFDPKGTITRQEAAAMLTRTAKLLGLQSGTPLTFRDAGRIAGWARERVSFVSGLTDPTSGQRLMLGTGEGNFSPTSKYTREQAILTAIRLFRCL